MAFHFVPFSLEKKEEGQPRGEGDSIGAAGVLEGRK